MSAAIQGSSRIIWIDAAKGIGIILVVIGHVWRGLRAAGLLPESNLFHSVDAAIYLFHMPLFFFVSALFFEQTIIRQGVSASSWRRLETLLYPLLLWSYVMAAFLLAAGQLTNRPALSFWEAALFAFPPRNIFWFLWALFLVQTLVSLIVTRQTRWLVMMFVMSFGAVLTVDLAAIPSLFRRSVEHLPYFLAGTLIARGSIQMGSRVAALLGAAAFLAAEIWAVNNWGQFSSAPRFVAGMAATIGFCYVVAWFSPRLPHRIVEVFAKVGVASIGIYVSHVITLAGIRIVLVRLDVSDLMVHLLAGTAAGLIPPMAFYYAARYFGVLRWFGLGARVTPAASKRDIEAART